MGCRQHGTAEPVRQGPGHRSRDPLHALRRDVGGGVFKSTDSGGTWAAANTGLTSLDVLALAINPATPSTLYAGTYGGGVFKSNDSGGTWAAVNAGLPNPPSVNALALDPTGVTTLYAGLLAAACGN